MKYLNKKKLAVVSKSKEKNTFFGPPMSVKQSFFIFMFDKEIKRSVFELSNFYFLFWFANVSINFTAAPQKPTEVLLLYRQHNER